MIAKYVVVLQAHPAFALGMGHQLSKCICDEINGKANLCGQMIANH
jgi:hypothetical protein